MKHLIFFLAPILIINSIQLFAQAGKLDSSFGKNGINSTDLGTPYDFAYSTALQADGKILVAGRSSFGLPFDQPHTSNDSAFNSGFDVVRYKSNGRLDKNFGDSGIVYVNIGTISGASEAHAITVQPDGKILVAGYVWTGTEGDFAVVRLKGNGVTDSSFGQNGIFTTPFVSGGGIINVANSILIQPDNKIILAGTGYNGKKYVLAMIRISENGILDASFGKNGTVLTNLGGVSDFGNSATLQPDGKLLLGGIIAYNVNANDFLLARYTSDGKLDESFGKKGFVTTTFGNTNVDAGESVVLQADGKIILAGYANFQFAMARYQSNGRPDTTFGNSGKVRTKLGTLGDFCYDAKIQSDGKIILVGSSAQLIGYGEETFFALVRYHDNGIVDSAFGTNGVTLTSFFGYSDYGRALTLQPDGKIVAAGYVSHPNNFGVLQYDYGVAQYLNDLNLGKVDFSAEENNSLLIYPNPLRNEATLRYELAQDENISIDLYDVSGIRVQSISSTENEIAGIYQKQINIDASLPDGNYILVLNNGMNAISIKLLKQ